ncbi:MAG: glycosyl hydrolase 108 family protein [Bacillota bacterium]|jgi:lysozyme family protein
MADFEKAYRRTCKIEAGYSNKKTDRGGETWRGIARNYHPKWKGWEMVDRYKKTYHDIKSLNKALAADEELENLVLLFYRAEFWNINRLSEIPCQLLAENVYDAGVNCGVGTAAKMLQKAVNRLRPNGLVVDGAIGNRTIEAVSQLGNGLIKPFVDIRVAYHKNIVANDSSQKVNLAGWLARCESMRKETC